MGKFLIDYDTLYKLYISENKTVREISEMYSVCKQTVEKKLSVFQIQKPKKLIKECISKNCPLKNPEIRKKIEATNLRKYGVKSLLELPDIQGKSNSKEARILAHKTRKKNGSYKVSSQENKLYEKIKAKYPDVIRQYSDERYPFLCDFYIPSLDLFIEYQGHKGHGDEPFDKNNPEHLEILRKWKSKRTLYYNKCIKTWTITDPYKREVAKNNGINLKELWNTRNRNK